MTLNLVSRAICRTSRNNVNDQILKCTSWFSNYLRPNENVENTEKVKKKTISNPLVTLIRDDQLSIVTLEDALKLSKRRDLRLVKVVDLDTKTQRPTYKLMKPSEYQYENSKGEQKSKNQSSRKGEKLLMINHNIFIHDLNTQLKKVNKWLEKFQEVHVVINGNDSNMEKCESVYNIVENTIGSNGRIVQKRQKGSDIKFQILPPKKPKDDDNS